MPPIPMNTAHHDALDETWLGTLQQRNRHLAYQAREAGIRTPHDYHAIDIEFDVSLRRQLDVDRYLVAAGQMPDARTILLRTDALPRWLRAVPISHFGLSLTNALRFNALGLRRIGDLDGVHWHRIIQTQTVSYATITDLSNKIVFALRTGPRPVSDPHQVSGPTLPYDEDYWWNHLGRIAPDLETAARPLRICDAQSYAEAEKAMPRVIHWRLGLARHTYLAGAVLSAETILDHLDLLPRWIQATPLSELVGTATLLPYVQARLCRHLGDLVGANGVDLLGGDVENIPLVARVASRLVRVLRRGPPNTHHALPATSSSHRFPVQSLAQQHPQTPLPPARKGPVPSWVDQLSDTHPHLALLASALDIVDDTTYLQEIGQADLLVRSELGWARYRHMMPYRVVRSNVLSMLAHSPEWMKRVPVAWLGVTNGTAARLAAAGAVTFGDLVALGEKVRGIAGLGSHRQEQLSMQLACLLSSTDDEARKRILERYAEHRELLESDDDDKNHSLLTRIERSLVLVPYPMAQMLRLRMGLDEPPLRAYTTSRRMDVHYRSILFWEETARTKYRQAFDWLAPLRDKLAAALSKHAGTARLSRLTKNDPWFAGLEEEREEALLYIVNELFPSPEMNLVEIAGCRLLTQYEPGLWGRAVQETHGILRGDAGVNVDARSLLLRLAIRLPHEAEAMRKMLIARRVVRPTYIVPDED